MKQEFLVVYEDLWHNKESYRTKKIGDTIKNIVKENELFRDGDEEVDYDKYNTEDPFDLGTFGKGFYDIEFIDKEGEYAGRIMIFTL